MNVPPDEALRFIAHYPASLREQARRLVDEQMVRGYLERRYGDLDVAHEIQSNGALYQMAMELKRRYMSSSPPVAKVRYCDKISTFKRALGLHTYATRVHGSKLKTKHELRIASVYKRAPLAFLETVVVHELAHLREKDHGRAFSNLCHHMLPDYDQREFDMRLWLGWRELGEGG